MFISGYKTLSVVLLCLLWLPSPSLQAPPMPPTSPIPSTLQGLLSFKAKVIDPQGVLASWNNTTNPCSIPDCSSNRTAPDCNWAGIVCQAGQVVALAVPCTVLSNGATGPCALQGSPMDSLTQVSTLRLLDLSGNALQGTLPATLGSAMQSLVVLLLGSNAFSGTLPGAWSNMPNLQVADLGDNRLTGPLPPGWGALPKVKGLRLAANGLSGTLPASYGNWTSIQELELGGTGLHGTVPSSWAGMAALQDLELDYNCGICGNLPSFPMQASGQLSVDTSHSSIGRGCDDSNCSSRSNLALILRTVIGVLIVCAVLLVVGLRSWQLRRRRQQGLEVQDTWEFRLQNRCRRLLGMSPLVVPVVSTHQSHRRSRDTEMANGSSRRPRRTKSEQPTLVIMPDGHSLCFATRDPPLVGDASGSSHKPDVQTSEDPSSNAADQSRMAAASNQQQAFPLLPARYVARTLGASRQESMQQASVPAIHMTLPGSTEAGRS